ncbi:hypothetical protein ACFL2V_16900 [Pseudomonadota bacterium]
MKETQVRETWSLNELCYDFYHQFGIEDDVIKATTDVIESITHRETEPEARLKAYKRLDKKLQGENAVFRTPILISISGSTEVQAAVANGCGPSGLGIFPGGWWVECCNIHDECYEQGGGVVDKLKCDVAFWKCLWSKGVPLVPELYGLAVVLFGWFSFKWGGDDPTPEPPPNPCSGTCRGTEYRVTNLRNFQTVGRSVSQVLLKSVPRGGQALLQEEAEEISKIEWEERCESECRCDVDVTGEWQRSVTFLTVPANDSSRNVNYYCQATIWKREVSGVCK